MLARPASRLAILSAVLAVPVVASAAPKYWTNVTTGAHSLSTAANWEDNAALVSSADDIRFFINSSSTDLTLGGAYTITNDVANLSLNRLDLDGQSTAGGRSVTIDGLAFTLASGATLNLQNQASSGGNSFGYTISAPVTFAGGLTVSGNPGNAGTVTFSNATLANTASSFVYNSNNRINVNNVSLDANHSFSGTGTGGISFGGTVTLTGNRTLDVTGSSLPTLGGTISDGGNNYSITKTGSGVLTLGAANHTIGGGVILQAGALVLTAGGGTFNHASGGVSVQNGNPVRLEWGGTPSGPVVATNINYVSGGSFEFGASSGNAAVVTHSGNLTGNGSLLILARNGKDSINFTGDSSNYSGSVRIESSSPLAGLPSQVVTFEDALARPGSANATIVVVRNGGRVGFTSNTTNSDLNSFSFGRRSGIALAGASGVLDAAVTNPMALFGAGGGIILNNRDNLNNDRLPSSTGIALSSQSLTVVGRNANDTPTTEQIGGMTLSGGNVLFLNRPSSDTSGTGSGVRVITPSLTDPSAGQSLLIQTGASADFGDPVGAGVNALEVTSTKPSVTNGMVSAGLQHFNGGNNIGTFLTFSGNYLVPVTYNSGFNSGSSTEIANLGAATTLSANESAHAVRASSGTLALGGFTLTLGGGGLIMTSNTVSGGTVDFGSGAGFIGAYNSAAQANISAGINGSGGLTFLGTSQTLNVTGTNAFTGGAFVNGGSVRLAGTSSNGNVVTVNAFGRLIAGPSSNGTDTIGGLRGSGVVSAWVAGSGTSTGILNVDVAAATSHTFDGVLTNGAGSRILGLTKSGLGTQVLGSDASGDYTGATNVNAGTLIVNGSLSAASGAVTVASGAKLGGTGVLGGATTVNGVVAPGNSIGTLSVSNNVAWNGVTAGNESSATDWQFELGSANTADLLDITGNFLKGTGDEFRFDFQGSSDVGTFVLVNWTGTTDFDLSDFSYTNLGGGNSGTFSFNSTQLEFTVIPEPTTLGLLAIGGFGLLRRRR